MVQSVDVLFPVIVFVDYGTYSVAKDVHELDRQTYETRLHGELVCIQDGLGKVWVWNSADARTAVLEGFELTPRSVGDILEARNTRVVAVVNRSLARRLISKLWANYT